MLSVEVKLISKISPKYVRLISRLFLIFALMLVVGSNIAISHPAMAAGATYYVAKSGSDSNSGTESSPWLTIQKAANTVTAAGSTVYLRGGEYHETVSFTHGGTSGSPITYAAYPGESVIVNASGLTVSHGIFYVNNVGNLVFDGFEIKNATGSNQYNSGIWAFGSNGDNLTFKNLSISNCFSSGIFCASTWNYPVTTWMNNITIDNVNVSQCGVGVSPGAAQEMISLTGVDGFEIKNCTVTGVGGNGGNTKEGIDIKEGCNNGSVHDCEVSGAVIGLYIDGGRSAMNNISAYRNKLHDNHYEGIVLAAEDGADLTGINVYNNLIYNNKDRGIIVENYNFNITFNFINNTLYHNTNAEIAVYNPDAKTNGVIRNNIVSAANKYEFMLLYPSGGTHTTIDHNVFYNPNGYTGQTNTFGSNSIKANPLFVDASGLDFSLQSTSPAIDAGSSTSAPSTDFNGSSRPQGSACDAGAFEYLSGSNHAPILNTIGVKSVDEEASLSFTISATDSDGDTLIYSASNLPDGASFNASTRTFSWTPASGQAGTYTNVHFQVSDGTATDSENITITVNSNGANQTPVLAAIGNKSVNESSALSFTISATDTDEDALTYSASNLPSGASFNTSTRAFSWTPSYNQSGSYTNVHFEVTDGSLTDSENITITVNNTNRAPVLAAIGNKSVTNGESLNFTISATDADGGTLTYSASNLPEGAAFNTTSRTFSWTPAGDQTGVYTGVHFEVSDGALTDSENVSITAGDANRSPTLNSIGDRTVNEGAQLSFTVSGSDPDGDTLTYSASNLPSGASFNASTRTFSWTPTFSQAGNYGDIHFQVSDGTLDAHENITIVVNDVNRAPVLAAIGNKNVGKNQLLSFNILASDADGDTLIYSASNLPSGATFNATTRTFSWTPGGNQSGTHTGIHFAVTDGKAADSEDITVTVSSSNHAPTMNGIGNKSGKPNNTLSFSVSAADQDGDSLTYSASNLPEGASFNSSTGAFSWKPGADQVGSFEHVHFVVSDGSLTDSEDITITVSSDNQAPVLKKIGNKTIVEKETLTFSISAEDAEGDDLTYSADNLPAGAVFDTNTLTFTWTSTGDQVGTYTNVVFQVNDGKATDFEKITIKVNSATKHSTSVSQIIPHEDTAEDKGKKFDTSVIVASDDGSGQVKVPKGTTGKRADGKALENITVSNIDAPKSNMSNKQLMGNTVDFGPDGTTFSQPVTITLDYDPADLPDGVMERSLGISTWNAAEKRWVELPSKVNAVNNTVSAETTHFSIYTVMADISPADFVLSHITVKPSVVKEGEKVEVSALISNKGSVGGTYQAVLKLNGQEMGNQELTIDGGSNLTVHFEVIPDHTGIFSVQIGDLIGQLEVQQLPQPVFVTEEIEIESAEVNSGEEATARILIANTGSEAGTLDVILKVNGISEGFKQIEIKAGEFKEVVFNILKFDPGTYTVDINGKTASFTVVPDQTADTTNTQPDPTPVENTPEAETEFSLSMLAKVLGAGFILILGTVLAILIRRRQLIKNS